MIFSRDRIFKRKEAYDDAKMFIIFCEGIRREVDYFNYFAELDSRVRIEVIPPNAKGDNSPEGLLKLAKETLLPNTANKIIIPKYTLTEQDEIWFIIDTDKWEEKISVLYNGIDKVSNWHVGQSNPCFELWLYFHLADQLPSFPEMELSKSWKEFLNNFVSGGFNSKRHPILIGDAIRNASNSYQIDEDETPCFLSTSVHFLGEKIYSLLERKLSSARRRYSDL